jgi:hypothetical protein
VGFQTKGAGTPSPSKPVLVVLCHNYIERRRPVSAQSIDYAAMLADLEAKKTVIDSAIASVRAAMAAGALGVAVGDTIALKDSVAVSISSQPFDGDIPSGMFFGKSIPEATKLYLSMVKRKQTTKEIVKALEEGGMATTAGNFEPTVLAGLYRVSKKFGEIVRVKGSWGLAEWYKGMRVGPQEKKPSPRKKAKRKAPRTTRPRRPEQPTGTAQSAAAKLGDQARIEAYFAGRPGEEFSNAEVGAALSIRVQTVGLICAKLAHNKKLDKTPSGRFRLAGVHAMPKAS